MILSFPNRKIGLFLLSLALVSGFAVQADAREKKDDSVESSLKFKEGDEDGNEVKALKAEMLVIRSEKKALNQLVKLSLKYKGTRMEPEMLFRLAELYMRRARSERFFEVHKSSEQVMSFVPQLVKEASEIREVHKAIDIYDRIQIEFPHFRSMDVVVFNDAFAHQQVGEDKKAEELFIKLTQKYPDSLLMPDSLLALGEIAYHRKDFPLALERMKKVRAYPEARVYPYAIYKAAWCYYNMQNAASGLKELEDVIQFGQQIAAEGKDSKLDLRKEALNDMTVFYTDQAPASKAVEYFIKQAGTLDPGPTLLRLSGLYDRHSRYTDVEVILKGFLKALPNHESVPAVHENLVWNYERMHNRTQAVAELSELDRICREVTQKQMALNGKKSSESQVTAAPPECQSKMAETSKKLATKWHAIWRKKNPEPDTASSAEKAYSLYLQNIPKNDPDQNQMRFSYAELLFQQQKYRESSQAYAEIAAHQPAADLGKNAAYGAIVGLEKATNDKWSDQDEKTFISLMDTYVKNYSKGEYALELYFKRAFIAYEKGRYDEAAVGFHQVGWGSYPPGEKVSKAQDLYLDILNIKKDYKGLREAAQLLLQKTGGDSARTAAVEKIYREAYFAEIQILEEKGNYKEAIVAYKKFAVENKNAELSSKAWWNASQLQYKVGDVQGGANTCHQMYKLFPEAKQTKDCLSRASQTFESIGRLDLAAKVLLDLAELDKANELKWHELAADFFALSGNHDRAKLMYLKMAEAAKGDRQVALLEKASSLEKLDGNERGYQQLQLKISATGAEPQSSRMLLEQTERDFASLDFNKAFNSAKKIISRDSLPKDILARARFVQAQVLDDEFKKQSVKAHLERVSTVLALKTEKLEKAQKAYQAAIHYGDPTITVKSLRALADCYTHYAQTVRGMQLQGEIPEADLKAFQAEIEKMVIPMEEKGVDTLAQAIEAVRKFKFHDGTIGALQAQMDQLNMKKSSALPLPTGALPAPPHAYVPRWPAGESGVVRQQAGRE
jgi:TolA-binding protein